MRATATSSRAAPAVFLGAGKNNVGFRFKVIQVLHELPPDKPLPSWYFLFAAGSRKESLRWTAVTAVG
jgi:hypothetical protein